MSNSIRVYELNKLAGAPAPSKELMVALRDLGYVVKSPSSKIEVQPTELAALWAWWSHVG